MSLIIATVYVVASHWLLILTRRWIAGGLAYGVVVFFVMNYVVVPLSAWTTWPHFTAMKFVANLLAMLLFGLITAFFAQRLSRRATLWSTSTCENRPLPWRKHEKFAQGR